MDQAARAARCAIHALREAVGDRRRDAATTVGALVLDRVSDLDRDLDLDRGLVPAQAS